MPQSASLPLTRSSRIDERVDCHGLLFLSRSGRCAVRVAASRRVQPHAIRGVWLALPALTSVPFVELPCSVVVDWFCWTSVAALLRCSFPCSCSYVRGAVLATGRDLSGQPAALLPRRARFAAASQRSVRLAMPFAACFVVLPSPHHFSILVCPAVPQCPSRLCVLNGRFVIADHESSSSSGEQAQRQDTVCGALLDVLRSDHKGQVCLQSELRFPATLTRLLPGLA